MSSASDEMWMLMRQSCTWTRSHSDSLNWAPGSRAPCFTTSRSTYVLRHWPTWHSCLALFFFLKFLFFFFKITWIQKTREHRHLCVSSVHIHKMILKKHECCFFIGGKWMRTVQSSFDFFYHFFSRSQTGCGNLHNKCRTASVDWLKCLWSQTLMIW